MDEWMDGWTFTQSLLRLLLSLPNCFGHPKPDQTALNFGCFNREKKYYLFCAVENNDYTCQNHETEPHRVLFPLPGVDSPSVSAWFWSPSSTFRQSFLVLFSPIVYVYLFIHVGSQFSEWGLNPCPLTVGAQSRHHWTTSETPDSFFLMFVQHYRCCLCEGRSDGNHSVTIFCFLLIINICLPSFIGCNICKQSTVSHDEDFNLLLHSEKLQMSSSASLLFCFCQCCKCAHDETNIEQHFALVEMSQALSVMQAGVKNS